MIRILLLVCLAILSLPVFGQDLERPSLQIGKINSSIKIDGRLDEPDWHNAPVLEEFLTTEPLEKGKPSNETRVRVIADERSLIIGVECKDSEPNQIVRFSKLRDADISNEDHVKVVIDPFMDDQSGYIWAVNAFLRI